MSSHDLYNIFKVTSEKFLQISQKNSTSAYRVVCKPSDVSFISGVKEDRSPNFPVFPGYQVTL